MKSTSTIRYEMYSEIIDHDEVIVRGRACRVRFRGPFKVCVHSPDGQRTLGSARSLLRAKALARRLFGDLSIPSVYSRWFGMWIECRAGNVVADLEDAQKDYHAQRIAHRDAVGVWG